VTRASTRVAPAAARPEPVEESRAREAREYKTYPVDVDVDVDLRSARTHGKDLHPDGRFLFRACTCGGAVHTCQIGKGDEARRNGTQRFYMVAGVPGLSNSQ
jgi:hypothetical protein